MFFKNRLRLNRNMKRKDEGACNFCENHNNQIDYQIIVKESQKNGTIVQKCM